VVLIINASVLAPSLRDFLFAPYMHVLYFACWCQVIESTNKQTIACCK